MTGDRWAPLRRGMALAGAGVAVELGVHRGASLRVLAGGWRRGPVFGFDSFAGLAQDWTPGWPAGTFALPASEVPRIPGAMVVAGWFASTLPAWVDSLAPDLPLSLVHVDCDLYASTRDALSALGPLIRPGCVLVFDEWWGYPGWVAHEFRAWHEWAEPAGVTWTLETFYGRPQAIVTVTGRR